MSTDEEEGLLALLDANGLTKDDLDNHSAPVKELEMFLQEYPKMLGLNKFPNLTTLKLIDQCIEKIEGLSGCHQLEQLWLMENKITTIQGLEGCTRLKELYLYSNRITSVAGLEHLKHLEVLWLADNYISSLSGLSKLTQLRQLNVARNDITSIGNALLPNTVLTSLNIADNKISSFQDVAGLSKIKGLEDLCLADPFWGECPVAGLCNYQTFMLYLLPQLTSLDTLLLAEETKAAASATFTKKQLYYNMRIRTLRRAAASLVQQAKSGCKAHASRWAELHGQLACAARSLQRQLQSSNGSEQAALQEQLSIFPTAMQTIARRQQMIADKLAADIAASVAAVDAAVERLQLELSSGGNIRLEEARPNDSWLASCQELMKNKLIQAGDPGGGLGIADIQVVSVAKVHNRHLRLQFDRLLNSNSSETGDSKPCTEYMFYGEHHALPGELMHAAQHGFRSAAEYSSLGLDAAVRLANCVNLADQLRLQHTTEQSAAAATGKGLDNPSSKTHNVLEGQLLVCKVLLGNNLQEAGGHVQLMTRLGGKKLVGKDGHLQPASCLDGPRMDQKQYPTASAVYRTAAADSGDPAASSSKQQVFQQHRVWYVFDNTAVLPEYLVTFRYTAQQGSPLATACISSEADTVAPAVSSTDLAGSSTQSDPLLKLCAQPLQPWLTAAQQQQQGQKDVAYEEMQQRCKSLVTAAEKACPKVQLITLSPAALTPIVGGKELSTLTSLSLHNCGLTSCEGILDHLPRLQVLVLSFNKLATLDSLTHKGSSAISSLDVSHNQICSWSSSWLAGCMSLVSLDASSNQLADIDSLQQLARSAPHLQQLDLSNNPIQQHKAYQLQLSGTLHQLQQLDGKPVVRAGARVGAMDDALLKGGATHWHSEEGPVVMQPSKPAGDWHALIHTLALEGKGLHSLAGIGAASQLVCAHLADNMLTGLAGLQACGHLRELNVSNNLIAELEPLAGLSSLRQLDVSVNHVSSLMPLSGLTGLSQLSVEGNQLTSLQGLTALTGLLELYAAGNDVADMKEAERLAVLPRLVILDLADNPVCATEDYRLLLLYRLRHLKVLDGVPAEPAELAAARAKYSGRLTMSFLEEQLGSGCPLSAIRGLDVSNLNIKDVGSVFSPGSPFSSLTELVLDNNQISSVSPLGGLVSLVALKMCNNRLGDAEAAAASFAVQTEAPAGMSADQSPASNKGIGAFRAAARQQAAQQPLLPNLQVLYLGSNGLTSLKPLQLQHTTGLRSLFVQGNDLQRLDGLEGLVQLRELVADKNKLRVLELETLSTLTRLQDLRLEDNLIKNLALPPAALAGDSNSPVVCLPSLSLLQLAGNRLIDVADVDKLAALPGLTEVTLAGNPVAKKQTYRPLLLSRCPRLEMIDGQTVTDEERSYAEYMYNTGPPEAQALEAAAGWLAAAADARQIGWPGLAVGAAPAAMGSPIRGTGPGKLAANMPAVLNYDALAQLAINANSAPLQIDGKGAQLPGVASSVPSIQSGVLVLSGPAAFGLSGSSIGSGGSGSKTASPARNASSNGRPRPGSGGGKRPSGGGAVQQAGSNTGSPAGRRVMGHSNSGGSPGGFPTRQVAYRGY